MEKENVGFSINLIILQQLWDFLRTDWLILVLNSCKKGTRNFNLWKPIAWIVAWPSVKGFYPLKFLCLSLIDNERATFGVEDCASLEIHTFSCFFVFFLFYWLNRPVKTTEEVRFQTCALMKDKITSKYSLPRMSAKQTCSMLWLDLIVKIKEDRKMQKLKLICSI